MVTSLFRQALVPIVVFPGPASAWISTGRRIGNATLRGKDDPQRDCPIHRAKKNLLAMFQGGGAGDVEQIRKFEMIVKDSSLIRALCCTGGWNGDGTGNSGGALDSAVCWADGGEVELRRYARCCFGRRLHELSQTIMPQWMEDELNSDFAIWGERGLTSDQLDEMENTWGHVFCRFRVRRGRLETCRPEQMEVLGSSGPGSEPFGQFESMARASRLLLALGLLAEGSDFFVSVSVFDHMTTPVPVLTKARAVFTPGLIRVPSYELIGPLLDKVRNELTVLPWQRKIPQLFWRGGMRSFNSCPCASERSHWPKGWQSFNMSRFLATSDSLPPDSSECQDLAPSICRWMDKERQGSARPACRCQRHIMNQASFEYSNRVRLCELSGRSPELVDAKLAYVPESYDSIRDMAEKRGFVAHYSKMEEQGRFRYLMSTDGSTIDDTRIYWMLSSGSVVFKQVTPLVPYGIPGLEPWKHFVPVREDLADLLAKVRWARAHDAACREMAERAMTFAKTYFTEDHILFYIWQAIQRYQTLIKPVSRVAGAAAAAAATSSNSARPAAPIS
eukprot:TRINITY_DN10280_c2_g1_i1.p1 TRINITY_DN10280_c2_g1~~TRINITY_DN10280_c2_g1_i1.p1  ORF type:complete len:572 (+),score=55.44 TRINITY_DN10280_c2_g1_i1:35-1717(+)